MTPADGSLSMVSVAGHWAAAFLPLALKGSLLLGLVLLAARLMRRASASTRHLLLALGVVGMLLMPIMEAALPSWQVIPVSQSDQRSDAPLALDQQGTKPSEPAEEKEASGVPASTIPSVNDTQSAAQQASFLSTLSTVPAHVWGFAIWLSGILLLGFLLIRGMLRLRRLRCESRLLTNHEWTELLWSLCKEVGIASPPRLHCSPCALTPMTWGLARSVIMLPTDCGQWTEEQRREVLLHELAHVRRRDCLTHFAAQVVCLFYWFNPLVWLATRRMRTERERACDDRVLMEGARPSSYAGHLLDIAKEIGAKERAFSAGLAMARRSRIFDRLDAVLDPKRSRQAPGLWLTAALIALTLATLVPLAAIGPAAIAQESAPITSDASLTELIDTPSLPSLLAIPSVQSSDSRKTDFGGGTSLTCERGGKTYKLEVEGTVEFNEDDSGIVWMADDARFEIKEEKWLGAKSVEATAGTDGRPVYEYKEGRSIKSFDDEASEWLATTLRHVMLMTGINAYPRVRETYEQDGVHGILVLIDEVDSGYAKGIYYSEFLALSGLEDSDITPVLEHLPYDIESDYVVASVLGEYVDRHLGREGTNEAFVSCVVSMESDFQKATVLQRALQRGDLTHPEAILLMEAAAGIESDFQAANVLTAIERGLLTDERTRRAFFDAVKRVESDHQKAEILSSVASYARKDPSLRDEFLEAAECIESQFQRSRVKRALR